MKKVKRIVSGILSVVLVVSLFAGLPSAQVSAYTDIPENANLDRQTYNDYLNKNKGAAAPEKSYPIDMAAADQLVSSEISENEFGHQGKMVKIGNGGSAQWKVDVDTAGLYNVYVSYYQLPGRGTDIEMSLYINGRIPFDSAEHFIFRRIWKDEVKGGKFDTDFMGNDIKPKVVEDPVWSELYLSDYLGYIQDPYQFHFQQGENILKLESLRESMAIREIRIEKAPKAKTYKQAKAEYDSKGYAPQSAGTKEGYLKIQAEMTAYKNDTVISPVNDRTSPATEPSKGAYISLNYIGGNNWKTQGQSISWEVKAPKEGLYKIALKYRQRYNRDMFSTRRLLINGEVPFEEANNLVFLYDNGWESKILGDSTNGDYYFYLKEGVNTLTLQVSLGEIGEVIRMVDEALKKINECYRKILMLTGPNPDIYRDYNLHKHIPDTLAEMKKQAKILSDASTLLHKLTKKKGTNTAVLDRIAYQIDDMAVRHTTIPQRFTQFKDNLGALGTWLLSANQQALDIDYILVGDDKMTLPKADAHWYEKFFHEIASFINSFFMDYNLLTDNLQTKERIVVWISTGRDQSQVIKKMIDDDFSPNSNIGVDLKLVQPGVLLSATVAGIGPDVFIQAGGAEPVNYAIRGAVKDLTKFEGYNEVSKRFHPQAIVPFRFNGGIYALPETQSFPMLFYRKDILGDLGVKIPDTWEEIYEILPTLQKNNMEFAVPVTEPATPGAGLSTFYTILLQNGGQVYKENGIASALDEEVAIQSFKQWTNLYKQYKFPLTYNAQNRFRLGEVPILIADYTLYNMLSVFAPEIRGQWAFAQMPGVRQADGSINRSTPGGGQCVMMMNDTKNEKASWKFMDWFTTSEMQARYGTEIEALLGVAARFPTANMDAVSKLPWPVQDYNTLMKQFEFLKPVPQVPGGYFTTRHLDNAFRAVTISGKEARETILDYTEVINIEIDNKRKEFGLEVRKESEK